MKEDHAFHCSECGNYVSASRGSKIPECCGKPMEQLPLSECLKDPSFAEHARLHDDDNPCVDKG